MEQRAQNDGVGRPRVIRTEGQILSILEEYDKSGFSVKEFCEVSDINEATFYYWVKKYRSKQEGEEVKGAGNGQSGFPTIEVNPTLVHAMPVLTEIGNIKLYKEVSAEYLKSLLS